MEYASLPIGNCWWYVSPTFDIDQIDPPFIEAAWCYKLWWSVAHVWSQVLGGVHLILHHSNPVQSRSRQRVAMKVVCVDYDENLVGGQGVHVHIGVKWNLFEQLSSSQWHVTNSSHSSQVDETYLYQCQETKIRINMRTPSVTCYKQQSSAWKTRLPNPVLNSTLSLISQHPIKGSECSEEFPSQPTFFTNISNARKPTSKLILGHY